VRSGEEAEKVVSKDAPEREKAWAAYPMTPDELSRVRMLVEAFRTSA
jgi:hypothetical protein